MYWRIHQCILILPTLVKECTDIDTGPSVNNVVRQMEEEPHSGWLAINLA